MMTYEACSMFASLFLEVPVLSPWVWISFPCASEERNAYQRCLILIRLTPQYLEGDIEGSKRGNMRVFDTSEPFAHVQLGTQSIQVIDAPTLRVLLSTSPTHSQLHIGPASVFIPRLRIIY